MTLRTGLLAIAVVLIGAVGFVTLAGGEAQESTQGRAPEHVVQRGEYLVKIMGCNDCHTPWKMGPQGPEPDMTRFLSGHPEQIGPLPKAAAAAPYHLVRIRHEYCLQRAVGRELHIQPDTRAQHRPGNLDGRDVHAGDPHGKHMGVSRPINPPMPWPAYRNATDDDLKAIYAYLRTIKPIVNHVPAYQPVEE